MMSQIEFDKNESDRNSNKISLDCTRQKIQEIGVDESDVQNAVIWARKKKK